MEELIDCEPGCGLSDGHFGDCVPSPIQAHKEGPGFWIALVLVIFLILGWHAETLYIQPPVYRAPVPPDFINYQMEFKNGTVLATGTGMYICSVNWKEYNVR